MSSTTSASDSEVEDVEVEDAASDVEVEDAASNDEVEDEVIADPVLHAKLQELREAITNPPPFCSGVLALTDEAFTLTYGKRNGATVKSGYIDFLKSTEDELRQLAEACDPATFGKDDKDVLDLSYRTAGKMDAKDFLTDINLESAGLLDAIKFDLLDGAKSAQPVYAELYNMNVYGKGSFFKAHKDTPRSTDMFGSLVVVFPTPHEGGALALRHGGNETIFDSAALLKNAKEPSVAYVAFFSDVEHEVLPVTAGSRINITYNLYFREAPSQSRNRTSEPEEKMYKTLPSFADEFLSAFQQLLADPQFLPNGGTLGFGLSHKYDEADFPSKKEEKDINLLLKRLRGRDALVLKACRELSLRVSMKLVYTDEWKQVDVLSDQICRCDDTFTFCDEEEALWEYIAKQKGVNGKVIRMGDSFTDVRYLGKKWKPIEWVRKETSFNMVKSEYAEFVHYTAQLGHVGGNFCLVVEVGPPGQRDR